MLKTRLQLRAAFGGETCPTSALRYAAALRVGRVDPSDRVRRWFGAMVCCVIAWERRESDPALGAACWLTLLPSGAWRHGSSRASSATTPGDSRRLTSVGTARALALTMSVHPLPILRSPGRDLVRRALRWRRRGEARRALVAFREACAHEQHCPRTWTLYAVLCAELGRLDDAHEAFRHAMWLRKQAHQTRRVTVLEGLIVRYGLDRQCA